MHGIWKGFISFGLVHIPVGLYSGSKEREFGFHLYHKKDLGPVRYARICEKDGKELEWNDVVKGYEYKKGKVLVVNEKELENAYAKRTKTIDIVSFVDKQEIDPIYFEKPYFLAPDKTGMKPYLLLREALKKSGRVGFATFVLSHHERIGIIEPYDNLLVLTQLRYTTELRSTKGLEVPGKTSLEPRELKAAMALIEDLSGPFRPEKFKDKYTEELKKIFARKAKGKGIIIREKSPKSTKVYDLLPTLQASLKKRKKSA